jgi:hypothetical protein
MNGRSNANCMNPRIHTIFALLLPFIHACLSPKQHSILIIAEFRLKNYI